MSNQQRFSGEWETKRLGEISEINPQNFSSNTNPNYKFNYITLEQVDSGKLIGYSEEIFRSAPSRAQRVLQNGDVLMSTVRPNLTAHLLFQEQVPNAVCSTGFAVLRAKHNLSVPYFLFSQLFSEGVNDQIDKILSGSNYPAINSRDVNLIEIPCPPQIEEQRAIAEVLSDVDGLINALDALIAKKRAIKQASMQQLLTGKTRLPGFSGDWETKRFEEVFKRLNGNFHKIPTSEYSVNGLHPVIDQGQETIIAYSDRTEKLFKCPADGVIVFGDHTRIVKYVDMDFLIGADGTQLITTQGDGITKFFFYQLSIKDIPNTGYNRHFKFLKDLTFEIPNIEKQRAIAAVLSDIDAEIAALEQRRDKTAAIKQGMMQQLLTGKVRLLKSEIA